MSEVDSERKGGREGGADLVPVEKAAVTDPLQPQPQFADGV